MRAAACLFALVFGWNLSLASSCRGETSLARSGDFQSLRKTARTLVSQVADADPSPNIWEAPQQKKASAVRRSAKLKPAAKEKSERRASSPPQPSNSTKDSAKSAGGSARGPKESNQDNDDPRKFSGNASWYGIPFHGRKTASGEVFDMYKLSAAHKTVRLPTWSLVEDPRTGNVVIVKINDRGPYAKGRVMDLSREAARRLGTMSRGVFYIEATLIEKAQSSQSN